MAKIEFVGFEGADIDLNNALQHSAGLCKASLYAGAGVAADGLRAEVMGLPEDAFRFIRDGDAPQNVLTAEMRQELADSIGISKIEQENGVWTVAISFDGYSQQTTNKYPKGLPLAMIARSIEKGTSYHAQNAFVKRNSKRVKQAVLDAMASAAKNKRG